MKKKVFSRRGDSHQLTFGEAMKLIIRFASTIMTYIYDISEQFFVERSLLF